MIQAVAIQFGRKLSRTDVMKMSIQERSHYLQQNPITGVRMFQHRLESFFSQYLLSSAHPLGHITDYVIKIEFQMRGSPHAHCLLWVKDAPKIDQDPDEVVCKFIDKYITATIPNNTNKNKKDITLMESLQKHSHSDYCCHNKTCRFGFPKPPAIQTLISRVPTSDDKKNIIQTARNILQKVQQFLSSTDIDKEDMTIDSILQAIGVDINAYNNALQVSK